MHCDDTFSSLFSTMDYWKLFGIYGNLIDKFICDFNKLMYNFIIPI